MTLAERTPSVLSRPWMLALCAALPLLGTGYQVAAKTTALALADTPFGPAWFARLASLPSTAALLGFEVLSFGAWLTVLASMRLSAAFPLTALGYVLVIVTGWLGFHEPADALQVAGGGAILAGVWLLGREPSGEGSTP